MGIEPHMQMINPTAGEQETNSKFTCFSSLPQELRLKIWRHAMQRPRYLKVRLKDRSRCDPHPDEKINNSERYVASVDGHQILSKYLRVNQESRAEFLSFYRVHLPCRLYTSQTEDAIGKPGTIYLNPENDYIYLCPEWSVKNTLFDFFYHLKNTYDPHRIGLLNLATEINCLNGNDSVLLQPSQIDPPALQATQEIFSHLREVFFISTPRAGRQSTGYLSGLPTSDIFWNRSFPIMARPSTFERLKVDPRNITEDLRKLYVGMSDPISTYSQWVEFLHKWGGASQAQSQVQYRFLLAFDPIVGDGDGILDRATAEKFLRQEEINWTNDRDTESTSRFLGPDPNRRWPIGATKEDYDKQDKSDSVRPAFGFWLFPLEAVVPSREDQGSQQSGSSIMDLSKHWPELGLLNMN